MTKKLWLVGLLQAAGVVIYCLLISGLFYLLSQTSIKLPQFFGMAFMLTLLVFSAAVCGLTVFGYPVYLAINKNIKSALKLLLYTLAFILPLVVLVLIFWFIVKS